MTPKEKVLRVADALCMDVGVLFLTIYEAKYHRVQDVSNDVVLFDNLGIVPDYVQEFVDAVTEKVEDDPYLQTR